MPTGWWACEVFRQTAPKMDEHSNLDIMGSNINVSFFQNKVRLNRFKYHRLFRAGEYESHTATEKSVIKNDDAAQIFASFL